MRGFPFLGEASNWMMTLVFIQARKVPMRAEEFRAVIEAEVDLDARMKWGGPGDLKGAIPRFRPVSANE
jgi:hypothetical protein